VRAVSIIKAKAMMMEAVRASQTSFYYRPDDGGTHLCIVGRLQ
jgi:hypothetical protein